MVRIGGEGSVVPVVPRCGLLVNADTLQSLSGVYVFKNIDETRSAIGLTLGHVIKMGRDVDKILFEDHIYKSFGALNATRYMPEYLINSFYETPSYEYKTVGYAHLYRYPTTGFYSALVMTGGLSPGSGVYANDTYVSSDDYDPDDVVASNIATGEGLESGYDDALKINTYNLNEYPNGFSKKGNSFISVVVFRDRRDGKWYASKPKCKLGQTYSVGSKITGTDPLWTKLYTKYAYRQEILPAFGDTPAFNDKIIYTSGNPNYGYALRTTGLFDIDYPEASAEHVVRYPFYQHTFYYQDGKLYCRLCKPPYKKTPLSDSYYVTFSATTKNYVMPIFTSRNEKYDDFIDEVHAMYVKKEASIEDVLSNYGYAGCRYSYFKELPMEYKPNEEKEVFIKGLWQDKADSSASCFEFDDDGIMYVTSKEELKNYTRYYADMIRLFEQESTFTNVSFLTPMYKYKDEDGFWYGSGNHETYPIPEPDGYVIPSPNSTVNEYTHIINDPDLLFELELTEICNISELVYRDVNIYYFSSSIEANNFYNFIKNI